ncbi:MAG: prepilin-type N-terminal cleavage/methylation domain-containing protein [bacterium]
MLATLRNKKGVTLVELLAVIVIMGIIAAIAVPAIGGLIQRQKEKAAEADYNQIVEVAGNYAQSEDLASGATFTSTDLVTDDYMSSDPFDSVVTFTVGASYSVTITDPADAADITINGIQVPLV